MPKVIHIGPAPTARGGIASVLLILERSGFFDDQTRLVISYDDRTAIGKIVIFVRALLRVIFYRALRAQILHLHSAAYISFWRKSIFFCVAKMLGMQVVLHWHSPRLEAFLKSCSAIQLRLVRYVFRHTDSVITVSNATKRELLRHFPDLSCVVLSNPADMTITQIPNHLLRSNIEILFMAALVPEKGIFDLIDAFAIVRQQHPSVRLIVCGSGEDKKVRQYVENKGLIDSVDLLGWVSGASKQDYYQRAAVFCLPSSADTFGMANLDAMVAGLPVISTWHGGIPEVVADSETGILVQPHDVEALAKALLRLLADPDLRAKMGACGAVRAKELFAPETLIARLEEIYAALQND